MSYDALIIGAGHNGLVAAALLAKAGLRVLVCERRETPGGLAAAEALFPGFRVNLGADDAGLLLPEVIRELQLTARGVDFYQPPAAALALHSEGQSLTLWRDAARTAEALARYSSADARRFPDFVEQTTRFAGLIHQAARLTPPPLKEASLQEGWPWLRLGTRIRGLGRREMMEFLRILPLPVGEYLEEWFETPLLKAALAAPAILGNSPGPMAAGTTLMMLYHQMGGANGGFKSVRFVKGGMGTLIRALETALREHGAEIRTGCPVNRIRVEDGRAVGVELGDGEVISARAVLSTADPSRTFLHLVGAPALEPRFVRKVRNIRFRGVTARMILALDGLPAFPESITEAELTGYILICPDLLYMERAADDAKYGRISRRPCLWMTIPTLSDPSLAPPGKHLLNITMQYAPYHLRGEKWENAATTLRERILTTLESYLPGIRQLILHEYLITPAGWEERYGLTGGHIYHGDMGLDQLAFMRPVAGWGRYRTPVAGLYLCGAGTHPGGGVTGAPGYNAVREVLGDLR